MPNMIFNRDYATDTLFLTVNSRLARYLQTQFDQSQTQSVTETLHVMPFNQWLIEQFHANNPTGKILLSDFQTHCVWEDIINQSPHSPDLLQPSQTAYLVKQAWQLLHHWQVPLDQLQSFERQLETQCLLAWFEQFQHRSQQAHWITQTELANHLMLIMQSIDHLPLPSTIVLIGFDDFPPAIQLLLNTLALKTTVCFEQLTTTDNQVGKVLLPDPQTELRAMAQWAKQQWQQDPTQSIACVIPDLQSQHANIRRTFTDIFCPENRLPSNLKIKPPFNLSAGEAIAAHDLIKTALLALQWKTEAIPIALCSYLLQSPYLCLNESEKCLGALMDANLRKNNQLLISPQVLFEVISPLQASYPNTALLSRLRAWLQIETPLIEKRLPSEWAHHITHLLTALKWPGQHTQDSDTFQYLERFKKLLLTLSQLDLIYQSMTFEALLKRLNNLCQQTIFQPKSHQEPIQIMGMLEASSLLFDKAWVMSLHNGIWPPPTKPNPFIPFAIQQQYQMPHATAARELHFCQQVTNRLKKSAQLIVFSCPLQAGDQTLQPSAFMQDIPEITLDDLSQSNSTSQFNNALTTYYDAQAPAFEPSNDPVKGGSTLLKLQATCPFRAFATMRLQATPLDQPHAGLNAATRGTLTHLALYTLWGKIQDQTTLHKLPQETLNHYVDEAITTTFDHFIKQQHTQDNHYFWNIEKDRQKTLILQWLSHEQERPYFKVIARESPLQVTVGPLSLSLRIDRIDELADGSLLLIDYKTGQNKTSHWFQERLTEPQLPLYATANQTSYSGLTYAQVNQKALGFKGIVSENHLYAQNPTLGFTAVQHTNNTFAIYQWDSLVSHWQQQLTQLADEFCQGHATVNPASPQDCQFCELQSLCRIAEGV